MPRVSLGRLLFVGKRISLPVQLQRSCKELGDFEMSWICKDDVRSRSMQLVGGACVVWCRWLCPGQGCT